MNLDRQRIVAHEFFRRVIMKGLEEEGAENFAKNVEELIAELGDKGEKMLQDNEFRAFVYAVAERPIPLNPAAE